MLLRSLLKKNLKKLKPRKSKMKNIYLILIGLFATSCATVGSVIEGGKEYCYDYS